MRRGVCLRELGEEVRRPFFLFNVYDFCFSLIRFVMFILFLNCYSYFLSFFCVVISPYLCPRGYSSYIRKFPGEIRNQGWQGGLIATTRDELFWGG